MSKQFGKLKVPSNRHIPKKQTQNHANKFKEHSAHQQHLQLSTLKTCSVEELRQTAKQLRKKLNQRQSEVMTTEKNYRMELFKNQTAKARAAETDQHCEVVRMKLAERFINQYKGNKESPLFYNENGLSPFELMLLRYNRYESMEEHVCMICYTDIQSNTHTVLLPCQHLFHRQCAVAHLLYSKSCPGCTKEIVFELPKEEKMMKKQ